MISNNMSTKVRAGTTVSQPSREVQGHAPPTPYLYNRPTPEPVRGHASQAVLSDLGKLTPSLASGVRRVVGSK
jgi:hypothetical protein